MEEIMSRAECYIKGEERNAEKKARDAKERENTRGGKRNYYPPLIETEELSNNKREGTTKHITSRH